MRVERWKYCYDYNQAITNVGIRQPLNSWYAVKHIVELIFMKFSPFTYVPVAA